jgi:hypothetical protein
MGPQGIPAEAGREDLRRGPGRIGDEPSRPAPGRFPRFVVTLDLVQALDREVRWLVVDLLVVLPALCRPGDYADLLLVAAGHGLKGRS